MYMYLFLLYVELLTLLNMKSLFFSKTEMEKYREMYMKEIKEVTEKYKASEQALQHMKSVKRSNLGELQDDADERELLRQQREEVAMLKEQLQDQVYFCFVYYSGTSCSKLIT